MGVDCSLLFGYEEGIKEIHLDRSYPFSRIQLDTWLRREELAEQIRKVLNLRDSSFYSSYWMGYAMSCVENLYLNEDVKFLAIIEDNTTLYSHLSDAKVQQHLDFETRELILFPNAKDYLK